MEKFNDLTLAVFRKDSLLLRDDKGELIVILDGALGNPFRASIYWFEFELTVYTTVGLYNLQNCSVSDTQLMSAPHHPRCLRW